jgi:gliding motility-associated-like protein
MEPPVGSAYSNWGAFTFPQGTKIPPLGFIIIGGNHSQVPHLDFDINYYLNNTFGVQYLDGDPDRWFLRDEYGWVALYNTSGSPVDAVYWDLYGNPGNLNLQSEYASAVVNTTACNGTMVLPAARNIAGIEYAGTTSSGSYLSFQRTTDGVNNWYSTPATPTPRACNGDCVGPPTVTCSVTNESCSGHNGSITVHITDGHTGPYTIQWLNPPASSQPSLTNLDSGTYIVKVSDAYNCYIVYDTAKVLHYTNVVLSISQVTNEMCSASNGIISSQVTGGMAPFSYYWNSNPPQTTADLENVHAGSYSVTLTDGSGCTATASAVISNTPPPVISFINVVDETCHMRNGSATLQIKGGNPPYMFSWIEFPSDNDTIIDDLGEGTYHVNVTDNFCSVDASVVINNTPGPIAAFSVYPKATTIETPRIVFYDGSSGAKHWSWDFGDYHTSAAMSPVHIYQDTGTYKVLLMISDDKGCMDSVSHNALILDRINLFVPNAFSPDANGVNDDFLAFGQNITGFKICIYDRWGEEVFRSTDIEKGWKGIYKGKPAPAGVYSWIIWYQEDYRLFQMDAKSIKGHLTLIR